jgi:sulfur carrier protein
MPHELKARVGESASRSLSVNGERVASGAATLAALLAERGFDGGAGGVACAVNGQFVPRACWSAQTLADGDCIDVVAPVTGG